MLFLQRGRVEIRQALLLPVALQNKACAQKPQHGKNERQALQHPEFQQIILAADPLVPHPEIPHAQHYHHAHGPDRALDGAFRRRPSAIAIQFTQNKDGHAGRRDKSDGHMAQALAIFMQSGKAKPDQHAVQAQDGKIEIAPGMTDRDARHGQQSFAQILARAAIDFPQIADHTFARGHGQQALDRPFQQDRRSR